MTCVFFVRREEMLRLKVLANEATREFVLTLEGRDGSQRDQFSDAADLQRGWKRLEDRLAEEQWVRAGMPIAVPDRVES